MPSTLDDLGLDGVFVCAETLERLPGVLALGVLELGVLDGTDELDDDACVDEVSLSPPSVVLTRFVSVTDGVSSESAPDPQALTTSSSAAAPDVMAVRYMVTPPSSRPPVASPP